LSYSEQLATRVRETLAGRRGVVEKKMFGGLAFLLDGKMCCGVLRDDLVVRVGLEDYARALEMPHARPMDFTGKPMTGFVYVASAGCRDARRLRQWVNWGAEFVSALAAKKHRKRVKKRV
jgi:TfoX/Sxy family transcriptional regulator of competence genes